MKNTFIVATDGTPITVIFSENYDTWLENQENSVKNWLLGTKFDGKGFRILPSQDGTISKVILQEMHLRRKRYLPALLLTFPFLKNT